MAIADTVSGGSAIRDRLTSTYSVGVMQLGSLCGQPGEENNSTAANKWLMLMVSPAAGEQAHGRYTRLNRSRLLGLVIQKLGVARIKFPTQSGFEV
jgi:hypothetical protein